jgi:hypothetical protein
MLLSSLIPYLSSDSTLFFDLKARIGFFSLKEFEHLGFVQGRASPAPACSLTLWLWSSMLLPVPEQNNSYPSLVGLVDQLRTSRSPWHNLKLLIIIYRSSVSSHPAMIEPCPWTYTAACFIEPHTLQMVPHLQAHHFSNLGKYPLGAISPRAKGDRLNAYCTNWVSLINRYRHINYKN